MRSKKTLVKYKCKDSMPSMWKLGSLQLFINREGRITYSRVRHHQGKAKYKTKWAGSPVRIEHHPPKPSKNIDPQINWLEYKEYLLSKFSRSYALQVYNNGLRHYDCLENPQNISAIPASTRGNVLKAMVNLSKYLGGYQELKLSYGIMVLSGLIKMTASTHFYE